MGRTPRFHVLALYENGGHHVAYSKAARTWLDRLAIDSNFLIDYIQDPKVLSESYLSKYQLFIQLDYPPYGWGDTAMRAFQQYIEEGRGGWIGFHHATLLGEFDGQPIWPWFSSWMGGIRWKNYIPGFATATVNNEGISHPCMAGLPASFTIEQEEWYTYDRSPRDSVRILASVREDSYVPKSDITMGDHPVIWTNERVRARNVYIFMGHGPELFQDTNYTHLFRNTISWASGE